MFSQFRNAVENLAVQPMRRSTSQDSDTSNTMSRTNSGEGGIQSPTHLADSALSSIRKSLQAQRPSSPARLGTTGTANGGVHDPNRQRSRLEERLRASLTFGIGEVSNPSTAVSTYATNTPTSANIPIPSPGATPLSPTQTPLPDSPIGSPATENGIVTLASLLDLEDPLGASSVLSSTASSSQPLPSQPPKFESPVPTAHTTTNGVPLIQPTSGHLRSRSEDSSLSEKLQRVVELEEDDEEFQGRRYAEAQMPLPPSPPPEPAKLPTADPPIPTSERQPVIGADAGTGNPSPPTTTDPSQTDPDAEVDPTNATTSPPNNADGDAAGTDVEALRQQLKRFKERFTGSETKRNG